MKSTCVLMAVGNQTMLRSLKTLLEPHVEVSAMTDNVLSLIDAVEVLEPDLAIVHMTILDLEHTNFTRHLHSRFPELKMIVVSDHNNSVIVHHVLNQEANGFVFQDKAKTDLVPAVKEILRGGTYVSVVEGQKRDHRTNPPD